MKRLKSTSKYGQGLKARSNESKGAKKSRLAKDARDDHKGFMKLERKDPQLAQEIINKYKSKHQGKKTRIK